MEPIIISVKKPIVVNRKRKIIEVNIQSYDPRIVRIKEVEEPVLRQRGFRPVDSSLTIWTGNYRRRKGNCS